MAGLTAPLPDPYPVRRAAGVSGVVEPPGSKSISHRALNLALIGQRPAMIENLLEADDIAAFRAVLVAMGWRVRSVAGSGLRLEPGPEADSQRPVRLDCRSAGTLLRLLVATCAVIPGQWILDGSPRLRERPIGPLVAALRQLGAGIEELGRPGCAPVRIRGGRLAGGRVEIDAGESSQYVSALLMAALNAEGSIELLVPFLVSSPYVDTTLEVMADFGAPVDVRRDGEAREFRVEPRVPELVEGRYRVAGDDSAAAYPAAAAAICGGSVRLRGLAPASTQGDRVFLGLLERMGAEVRKTEEEIQVEADGALAALDCDLSAMPDQVPTLAAVAAFANGTTWIRNVAHLRIKESDRLAAVATELRRAGATVDELEDGLRIEGDPGLAASPGSPRIPIDTYDDHRIAMSMALVGMRRGGLSIRRPEVVGKSYPGFWADLEEIRR
ncbi:MAG: 3-phosphoshikimate 1-carboxyvinyltransferase [Acidobacteria bacterium]|nr:3-phosphoshikimate 1-carboxyvinyltransferase [Acidobacteriota bacterium]